MFKSACRVWNTSLCCILPILIIFSYYHFVYFHWIFIYIYTGNSTHKVYLCIVFSNFRRVVDVVYCLLVVPQRLSVISRRFGTLYRFYLHRWVGVTDGTDRVFRNVGLKSSDSGEQPRRQYSICMYLFIIRSVCWISCTRHSDQLFSQLPGWNMKGWAGLCYVLPRSYCTVFPDRLASPRDWCCSLSDFPVMS
jgi:hypothetical protein